MHAVVAQHEQLVRGASSRAVLDHARQGGPVVAAQRQEAHFALLAQALEHFQIARFGRLVVVAEQQEVETLQARIAKRRLHLGRDGVRVAGVGLHGEDEFVAGAAGEIDHGAGEFRLPHGAPVEVVDAALEGVLDHARRRVEGAADAEAAGGEAGAANGASVEKVLHENPQCCCFAGTIRRSSRRAKRRGAEAAPVATRRPVPL